MIDRPDIVIDMLYTVKKMKFYRYEDSPFVWPPTYKLVILYLVKETPKGYWISYDHNYKEEVPWMKKRWVSKTTRKRYAYPTKEEALENYKARKNRQIKILKSRLEVALKISYELSTAENPYL